MCDTNKISIDEESISFTEGEKLLIKLCEKTISKEEEDKFCKFMNIEKDSLEDVTKLLISSYEMGIEMAKKIDEEIRYRENEYK